MTEDQIEWCVEKKTDRADHLFMSGRLTTSEYDLRMLLIQQWAERQRRARKPLLRDGYTHS